MAWKRLIEGLPTNIPDLEEFRPIFLSTKATKISRGPTIGVLKLVTEIMLHMDCVFFNVESICGFTSTFVTICSATSHPFVFSSRIKCPNLDILKFIVTTLVNQNKKVSFIQVDEYGALKLSYESIKTFHNMNIIVQTKDRDAYSPNGKIEIPNNNPANITRAILLK